MTIFPHQKLTLGYCTNVHPGIDLESIRHQLQRHAVPAQQNCGLDQLGVGLWLPATAAAQLAGSEAALASFLRERRLRPYTINGFPYANFHQEIVKHRVYEPAWWQTARLDYTRQLANILAALLPDDEPIGSISTLPIGWRSPNVSEAQLQLAGQHLREMAAHLAQLESVTGRRIVLAVEPEPGCLIDTTEDVVEWFSRHLAEPIQRRYVTVCHDVCHAAVMMESQFAVIDRLASAGIAIGKVQVSSAVVADWSAMAIGRRLEALDQLREFAEDRYLHQTGRRTADGGFVLAEDLPMLLKNLPSDGDPVRGDERWVVHFHVPVFLERFGHLGTSHNDVMECLSALLRPDCPIEFSGHLEIETYAWSVLPAAMRQRELADDIANEVRWLQQTLTDSGAGPRVVRHA